MATKRQIAANKKNAKLSTGPRTERGKARSSRNSLKHGLLSQDLVMLTENVEHFDELMQGLIEAHQPAD